MEKDEVVLFMWEIFVLYFYSYVADFCFVCFFLLGHVLFRDVVFFVILVISWLLWSGYFMDFFLLSFGAGSCFFVIWFFRCMDAHDDVFISWGVVVRFIFYLFWLVIEILKVNLYVI